MRRDPESSFLVQLGKPKKDAAQKAYDYFTPRQKPKRNLAQTNPLKLASEIVGNPLSDVSKKAGPKSKAQKKQDTPQTIENAMANYDLARFGKRTNGENEDFDRRMFREALLKHTDKNGQIKPGKYAQMLDTLEQRKQSGVLGAHSELGANPEADDVSTIVADTAKLSRDIPMQLGGAVSSALVREPFGDSSPVTQIAEVPGQILGGAISGAGELGAAVSLAEGAANSPEEGAFQLAMNMLPVALSYGLKAGKGLFKSGKQALEAYRDAHPMEAPLIDRLIGKKEVEQAFASPELKATVAENLAEIRGVPFDRAKFLEDLKAKETPLEIEPGPKLTVRAKAEGRPSAPVIEEPATIQEPSTLEPAASGTLPPVSQLETPRGTPPIAERSPEVLPPDGQPNPSTQVEDTTRVVHAATRHIRDELGMPSYSKTAVPLKSGVEEAYSTGMVAKAGQIADSVIQNKRPLSFVEQSAMGARLHEIRVTQREGLARVSTLTDPDELAELTAELDGLRGEASRIVQATDIGGTEWGKTGRVRQEVLQGPVDSVTLGGRAVMANGGKPLDAASAKKIEELSARLASLETEHEALKQSAQSLQSRLRTTPRATKNKVFTQEAYDAAVARRKAPGVTGPKTRGASIDFAQEFADLVTVVGYHVESKVRDYAALFQRVEQDFPGIGERDFARALREVLDTKGHRLETAKETANRRALYSTRRQALQELRLLERKAKWETMGAGERLGALALESAGLSKNIKASLDLSAPGRQGFILSLSDPKAGARAFGKMFKAVTERGHDAVMADVQASPYYEIGQSVKLGVMSPEGTLPAEEAFVKSVLGISGNKATKIAGMPFAASERGYNSFLSVLRQDAFDKIAKGYEVGGKDLTRKQAEAIADYVNTMTGRGGLWKFEGSGDALNRLFFSARYLSSRLQVATGMPLWKAIGNTGLTSPLTRRAVKDYVVYAGAMATMIALAKQNGAKINVEDPNDPSFGQLRWGSYQTDLSGGMVSASKFLGKMGGHVKRAALGEKSQGSAFNDISYFLGGKLAPVPQALLSSLSGESFGRPTNPGWEAGKLLIPIGVEQGLENFSGEYPANEAIAAQLLDFFGASTKPVKN